MSRYFIRKGPIECFHVDDSSGLPVSTISVIDHNLPPLTFAFHLVQAAFWFQAIERKEIEPTTVTRRVRATLPPPGNSDAAS